MPPVTVPVSTLPDGRPVVAEIRLAADQITLTGAVPTAEDKARLEAFAADYALADAPVVDELTVDPNVPADAGVRCVELDAANFVDDSSDLSREQTQQLGRVVTAMKRRPRAHRCTSSATPTWVATRPSASWCRSAGPTRSSTTWWLRVGSTRAG